MSLRPRSFGLRTIAVVEILKGGLVLFGFLWVAVGYDNVPSLMERIVKFTHLNPEGGPAGFLLNRVANFNPLMVAGVVLAYVTIRFAEAYGLWRERHWAEWLAAISSTIYIPLEVVELIKHPSWREITALVVNVSIVIFLAFVLWRTRSRAQRTVS